MPVSHFFRRMLDALNDGGVIRSSMALFLKALSILTLAGGIYMLVDVLKASFELPTEGTIGGIIFSAFLATSILIIAQMVYYRATNIGVLHESAFTIIPIFSILIKAFGEVYLIFGMAVGVGGCIFMWLAKSNPLYLLGEVTRFLPMVMPEATFFGGFYFLAYYALVSFVVFVTSYFLAESMLVMTETAKNIRHLLKHS